MADMLPILGCLTIPLIMLAVAFLLGYLIGADKMPFRVVRNDRVLGVDDGLQEDYL